LQVAVASWTILRVVDIRGRAFIWSTGKTVLLNRINQIAEDLDCHSVVFEADSKSTLPELLTEQLHRYLLKIDRRRRVSDEVRNAFALLRSFTGAFSLKYSDIELGLTESRTTGALDLTDLLIAVAEAADLRDTTAVILIDEVQFISQRDICALVTALHRISQRQLPLLLMGAGLPQLVGLVGEAKSYAERLIEFPFIGRLSRENATKALVLPATEEGVSYEKEGIELSSGRRNTTRVCYIEHSRLWLRVSSTQ